MREKFNLEKSEKWYLHNSPTVSEAVNHKLVWDTNIQCTNIIVKEKEKIEKYQNLKREILRLWSLKKIDVIPVVLGALRSVTKNFEKYVDKIGIKVDLHTVQKTTLLRTAKILRKVLEY